jgi:hypothetical protein
MKKRILTIAILISAIYSNAQQALTLYNMDMISQSTQVNPSLMPGNQMYIGVPALSSVSFLFTNSGFTWRDIHKVRADDSVSIDVENAINELSTKNFISLAFRMNILEAGFKVKKTYLTFNVSEKANMNLTFPKELFELLLNGNAGFIGREVDLSTVSFDMTHYREYAVGFARQVSKKVTLGARVKYLYGMENVSSAKNNFRFYTAPDDYQLELSSEYVINTSMQGNDPNGSSGNYMTGLKNTGFGGDISATYQMNEKWKLNASIIDMGFIRWKSNVKNLTTAPGNYSFDGIDIAEFMSDSSSMDNVVDSMSDAFTPQETFDPYTTKIPTHFYINTSYRIDEKTNAAALLHAQSFHGTVQPSFTASINRRLTDHFTASLSYSMINQHFDNVGAGIVVHMGAIQFYMISDNWIGTFNPLSNHTTHLNFGFNLVYGRPKKKAPSKVPSVTAIPAEFSK